MAKIPFNQRELRNAWRGLYLASKKSPRSNAHRLLLVYAVECGLKAMWMKQENRTLFDSDAINRTGHDLNEVIKYLRLSIKISPNFELCDVRDDRRNIVNRKLNHIDSLHQAWRYGGQLVTPPIDDIAMESELEQVNKLIEKELKS
jgi:hypothetical protein